MKKMKRNLAGVVALALLCALFSACGGDSELKITVTNSLGYDLDELYISSSDADWGESLLGRHGFEAGDSLELSLELVKDATYDVMAVDTDGDYYYFYELPLSNGAEVEIVSTSTWYEAVVTPKKGAAVTIEGDFEFGDDDEYDYEYDDEDASYEESSSYEEPVTAPTPDDPLDSSIAMPGYESLMVYYPSTMKVTHSNDRFLQIDAVNDPDNYNVILVDLIELQGTYDSKLSASGTAQSALTEIVKKICDIQFGDKLIKSIATEFVDGGTYYSAISYVWLSGTVFEEAAKTPVRGVVECRYYGHTGYMLALCTITDEAVIQNYFKIAGNMFDAMNFGGGTWSTPQALESTVWSPPDRYYDYNPWSDPGDYGYYYDDDWYDDYDPWSDPGDYGYYYDDYDDNYYYDDGEWYESNDYDPWSDPGDYGYDW